MSRQEIEDRFTKRCGFIIEPRHAEGFIESLCTSFVPQTWGCCEGQKRRAVLARGSREGQHHLRAVSSTPTLWVNRELINPPLRTIVGAGAPIRFAVLVVRPAEHDGDHLPIRESDDGSPTLPVVGLLDLVSETLEAAGLCNPRRFLTRLTVKILRMQGTRGADLLAPSLTRGSPGITASTTFPGRDHLMISKSGSPSTIRIVSMLTVTMRLSRSTM